MATIYIDGKPYEVKDGQNLLEACIGLGLNVPYFCWHPALGSVGACRQCAVKVYRDESDTQGRIVMSCMTPATDGTRITVDDTGSKDFRASVIEWMMTNHPHDCPVCDEGGECHLQDMTLMTGHNYRDYRFTKRTYPNQDLGPLINHEMNRCIQCYRCVRYYRDYAGGDDLNAFASHNHVYFGRSEDGTLQSEFSGNLVEVCPTGVFTDKTLKQHYTRRWDLTTAPSVCVHCALGCNITPGMRYGQLRRVRNRYNHAVNGYFLCDRGRYGYEFVNDQSRPKAPVKQSKTGATEMAREAIVAEIGGLLKSGAKAIGIGSPRASLESNFALRMLVGEKHYYQGVNRLDAQLQARILDIMQKGMAYVPSLGELMDYDAVLIVGEDLTNTAPLVALNVRQTVRHQPAETAHKMGIADWNDAPMREVIGEAKGPFFSLTPTATKLDDISTATYHAAPEQLALVAQAVAQAIDSGAPAASSLPKEAAGLVEQIAAALQGAKRPLVIAGPGCRTENTIIAAANVANALCRKGHAAGLYYTAQECNSVGMSMLSGTNLQAIEDAAEALKSGAADTLIVLENDLYRRAPEPLVNSMFESAKHVIVLDHTMNDCVRNADYVLPAGTFAEGDGTMVNCIGRAQRFMGVFRPVTEVAESWRWLRRIWVAAERGALEQWLTLDDFLHGLVKHAPVFARILDVAPSAAFRVGGLKIPRQSHRWSGRTAIHANVAVSEAGVVEDVDTPLAFSMEGFQRNVPARLMSSFWLPGWNSAQSITRFQEEVNGPLEGGDPGIRLFDPQVHCDGSYLDFVTPRETGTLTAVPKYFIFGSEELSVRAPGIAELAPMPSAGLHPEAARKLGVTNGDAVEVVVAGLAVKMPVSVDAGLAEDTVSLPVGLPQMPFLDLPGAASVARAGK
jgi:NADH-quinone oxidoreductase subunit G